MYRFPPIHPQHHPIGEEIGTFLPKSGSELRCSGAYGVAAGGFTRGRLERAGARLSGPLVPASFGTFLAGARKVQAEPL